MCWTWWRTRSFQDECGQGDYYHYQYKNEEQEVVQDECGQGDYYHYQYKNEEQKVVQDECGQGDYYNYQYKNENYYYHIKKRSF